jgi:hypothetical protein
MKASMPPTALESEMGLSACCFYLTFWYAPSSSTLCLSFVKNLAYLNLGFMPFGEKNKWEH